MSWEEQLRFVREQELYMVLDYVNISQNTRILEIGCGDGCQSAILRNYSNYVISTDITDERGYNELNLLCDGECLPFKDNQFDIVYSSNVLEHIPDKNKALNGMKRVLDDNGTIIIMVPTATWRIISCITYYPHEISYLLNLITKRITRPEKNYSNHFRKVNVENEKRPLIYYLRYILPTVHGTYPNIFGSVLIKNS